MELKDNVLVGGQAVVALESGAVAVSRGSRFSVSGAISGGSSLSWQKDGRALPTDSRQEVKTTGQGSSSLFVRDFRSSDTGMYTLSGANDAGSASSSVQITSTGADAPQILRMPSQAPVVTSGSVEATMGQRSVMITRGQTLKIRGSARGSPPPAYQWNRDGLMLTDGGRVSLGADGLLEVRKFRSGDAGKYGVTATNSAGSDSETIDVVLPDRPVITTPPVTAPSPQPDQDMQYFAGQNARIYRGRNLKLAVQASGRPVPGLTWRLPSGRRLKSGTSYDRFTVRDDGTLEVSDVRVSDEGTYRAIASNVAGLAKAKSRLSVLVPNSFQQSLQQSVYVNQKRVVPSETKGSTSVTEGQSFSIEAAVYGKPPPTMSWMLNDDEILSSDSRSIETSTIGDLTVSTLTVSNTGSDDAGTYTAIADGAQRVSDSATIEVQTLVLLFFLQKTEAHKLTGCPTTRRWFVALEL
ncbi:peroxidasin homolog [Corticium candelabrum]|uniref:peroxidasin homolog n=1 Tax=Corticium candelabrum TaxID=121492 RepID=UPI002E25390D|nr:peroxidasin homolog [Corticium candelabrum]